MRRVAAGALRTTCQCTVRGLSRIGGRSRRSIYLHQYQHQHYPGATGPTARRFSSSPLSLSPLPKKPPQQHHALTSSMYVRRLSVALVSGLVGYGAWYGYKGGNSSQAVGNSYSTTTTTTDPAGDATPTRNVLVVGAHELHTGTFVGDGPIAKSADGTGNNVLEMLTPGQATEKLRRNEASFMVNRGQGVLRYDVVQLASNNPIEDDHAEKIVEVASSSTGEAGDEANYDWMFWGVFDGHAGWTTSAKLRQSLINVVARELNTTYKAASKLGATPSPEAVDAAIKAGFLRLDNEIVHESVERVFKSNSKRAAAELLGPALSGSCALLAFYDSSSKTLRTACTGDSRAVLGRRSESGKWTATALSEDQTGSNPNEVARMRKAHPGEERVIHHGRVLGGLEPTRAFGDASYKWSKAVSDRLRTSFFSRGSSPYLKTPPYVTAEPVVTTTKISPERGDFLVLATDGLWEMLTNEEVVGLVGKWIENQATEQSGSQLGSLWSKMFGSGKGLPVEGGNDRGPGGQKTPIRQQQWGLSPNEERFVVKDKNVATHLIRNALGGKNEEQVIFFGNGQKTGEVLVNEEATSPPQPRPHAKL
ncbi:hypothetical protein DL766_010168 [Monosporascus sp. MC13-8B]|nr:hypothetical protein DL766_010168 [Monosporascus sp. MC13-8B]